MEKLLSAWLAVQGVLGSNVKHTVFDFFWPLVINICWKKSLTLVTNFTNHVIDPHHSALFLLIPMSRIACNI